MKKIQGVLFDEQLNVYRKETFSTKTGFLEVIKTLVDFTEGDEEPYAFPVDTKEEVNEFMDMYGYILTPLTKKQLDSFENIVHSSELPSNRLTLQETESFNNLLANDYLTTSVATRI